MSVGNRVVQGHHRDCRRAASTIVRTTSFAPAGFLISSMSSRLSPTAMRSNRPNTAPKRCRPAAISADRDAERAGEGGGSERVVDVVKAGSASSTRTSPPGAARVNDEPSRPSSSIARAARSSGGRGCRSSDSGSRRDGRRRPPRSRTACHSGRNASSRPHAAARAGVGRIVESERASRRGREHPISGSSPLRTRRVSGSS